MASRTAAASAGDDPWSRRVCLVGLLAVLLAFVAIGSMYALQTAPFSGPDEAAHLAYAHSVADLSLPEIDDPQPVPPSAVQWTAERDSAPSERHRSVWVANHPPLHYVLVAPLAAIAEGLQRYLPYIAGTNMASPNPDPELLGRVAGGIYFFAWVAVIVGLGLLSGRRRDA